MIIKAGTYRWNDELTDPNELWGFHIDNTLHFTTSPKIDADTGALVEGVTSWNSIDYWGSNDEIGNAICYKGEEFPELLIYSEVNGWNQLSKDVQSDGMPNYADYEGYGQIINVPYDQEVEDRLAYYFSANTKKAISGKRTFKDELDFSSMNLTMGTPLYIDVNYSVPGFDAITFDTLLLFWRNYTLYELQYANKELQVGICVYANGQETSDSELWNHDWTSVPEYNITSEMIKTVDFGTEPQYIPVNAHDWIMDHTEPYVEKPKTVKEKIQSLIDKANATTGKSDSDLTSGVKSLIAGYVANSICHNPHVYHTNSADDLPDDAADGSLAVVEEKVTSMVDTVWLLDEYIPSSGTEREIESLFDFHYNTPDENGISLKQTKMSVRDRDDYIMISYLPSGDGIYDDGWGADENRIIHIETQPSKKMTEFIEAYGVKQSGADGFTYVCTLYARTNGSWVSEEDENFSVQVDCTADHIFIVDELPTQNIVDGDVYLCDGDYYVHQSDGWKKLVNEDEAGEGGSSGGSGSGLSINGVIREYEVNAGANVNAGDFVEFVTKWNGGGVWDENSISVISACKLGINSVFIIYKSSDKLRAVVCSVQGNTITTGDITTLQSGGDDSYYGSIKAVALTDKKVFIMYQSNDYGAYANVCTIDGTTITISETQTIVKSTNNIANGNNIHIVALNESKVFVSYNTTSSQVARVCTIDGTSITVGEVASVKGCVALTKLTEGKVFISYLSGSSLYGVVCIIDENTIIVGVGQSIGSAYSYVSAVALTNSKVFIVYRNYVTSTYGLYGKIITIEGTTVTAGDMQKVAPTETSSSNAYCYPYVAALTDSKVFIVYRDYNSASTPAYYISGIVCTIEGNAISYGTKVTLEEGRSEISSNLAIEFSENSALVVSGGTIAKYVGVTIDDTTITVNMGSEEGVGTYVQPAISNLHNVGVAKTSGAEGETVEVYCVG